MKKQLMAAGLTAALVLGMAPAAFAADGAEVPPTMGSVDDGTMIKVKTSVTNINVTVPIALEVIGPVTGGGLTTVPTNYKIINKSEKFAVKVTHIKGDAQDGWTLSSTALDSGTDVAKDKTGAICLQLCTTGEADKTAVKLLTTSEQEVNWSIPAHSGTGVTPVTGELGIDIVKDKAFGDDTYKGSSIAVGKAIGNTASPAVKIVYTVAIDEGEAPTV